MKIEEINARNAIVNSLDQNMIVSASAGSGKTAILVERLVSLVEQGRDISKIAAITFTKKAANEFYERFYALLDKRSKNEPISHTFLPDLDPNNPLDQEKIKRDEEALKKIDLCFLGTIDAFFYRLISEFPIEANVPYTSELIESLEDEKVTIFKVFNDVKKGLYPKLVEPYKLLVETGFQNKDLVGVLTKYFDNSQYEIVYEKIDDKFEKVKQEYIKFLQDIIKTFLAEKDHACLSTKPSREAWDNFLALSEEELLDISDLKDIKETRSLISKLILDYEPDEGELDESIFKAEKKTKSNRYTVNKDNEMYKTYYRFIAAYTSNFFTKFYPIVMEELRKKGKLTFSMVSLYLRDLFRNEELSKSIIAKIQKEYCTFLVDEFQDTSPLQSEIFFRISSKQYAKNWKDSTLIPGYLFVVGDAKQGIYHFRGADILSFKDIRSLFNNDESTTITLDSNFRSNKELCAYFNDTFTQIMQKDDAGYQDAYPEINLEDKKDSDSFDLAGTYIYPKTTNTSKMSKEEVVFLIKSLVNNKSNTINGRPIRYDDIMVITRFTKEVRELKTILDKYGIPSFCEGEIDLETELPLFIKKLFIYLSRKSEMDKAELLSTSIFNVDLCSQNIDEDFFKNFIKEAQCSFDKQCPASYILETLINNETFLKYLSLESIDALFAIINYVKEKEANYEINTNEDVIKLFDELGNKKIERIARLSISSDSVQVANLHKVKGLQRPVIILLPSESNKNSICDHVEGEKITLLTVKGDKPYSSEVLREPFTNEVEKEVLYSEQENIRLLYVAATRAQNVLFIPELSGYWEGLTQGLDSSLLKQFDKGEIIDIEPDKVDAKNFVNKEIDHINFNNDETYVIVSPSHIENYRPGDRDYYEETPHYKNDKIDPLELGCLVHKLMELIVINKDKVIDKHKYISYIIKESSDEVKNEEYKILSDVYDTVYTGGYEQVNGLDKDILALARSGETNTEIPFSYKENNSVVAGYIDLIVELDDKIIIVDYKTDVDEQTDHEVQLNLYKAAITNFTQKPIETYIYNIKK